MPQTIQLIVAGIVTTIGVILYAISWRQRLNCRDENGRYRLVGTEKGGPVSGVETTSGSHGGIDYHIEYHRGAPNVAAYLVITVLKQSQCNFTIGPSQAGSRFKQFLKQHQVGCVNSGDDGFDNKFDVVSESSPAFVQALLQDDEVREDVESLLSEFTILRNDGKGFDALRINPADSEISPTTIDSLIRIAKKSSEGTSRRLRGLIEDKFGWLGWALPITLFPFTLLFAVPVLFATRAQHVEYPLFNMIDLITLLALVTMWFPVSYWLQRRRANSAGSLAVGWCVAIVIFWFFVAMFTLTANVAFDQSKPTIRVKRLVKIEEKQPSFDSGYYLYVESWRPRKPTERLNLVLSEADRLTPIEVGDILHIKTHSGFFGREWVSSIDKPGAKKDGQF